jgi:hypothetical protein
MVDELRILREDNNRLREGLTQSKPSRMEYDQSSSLTSSSDEFLPSRAASEGERDMDISETPLYNLHHLPSLREHEDETDSLAIFTFPSSWTSPPAIILNSSTHVEPPSEGVQTVVSSKSNSESEGQKPEPLQESSNWERVSHDADEETITPLSPAQIPLPVSPELSPPPSTRAEARLFEIERELEVAKRELMAKDAELQQTRDTLQNLMERDDR